MNSSTTDLLKNLKDTNERLTERLSSLKDDAADLQDELEEARKEAAALRSQADDAVQLAAAVRTYLSWFESPPPHVKDALYEDVSRRFRAEVEDILRRITP